MTSMVVELWGRLASEAVAHAPGVVMASAISSQGGVGMAVAGGLIGLGADLLSDAALRADRRGEVVTAGAGHLSPDEFSRWLGADPRHLSLAVHAVAKATWCYSDEKLRGLARALREGIDNDRVPEGELVVTALGALEDPHIEVLRVLANEDPRTFYDTDRVVEPLLGHWTIASLKRRLPTLASVVAPIEMTLRTVGVTHRTETTIEQIDDVFITPFGSVCLAYLEGLDRPQEAHLAAD